MTRTAVLIEVLDGAIDTYSPATHSATRPQHDTLSGAIETIRIELDETIDRVARLERATHSAIRPAKQQQDKVKPDKPDPLPRVDGEEQPAPYLYEKYQTTDKSWAKIADRYHWEKVILPNGKPKKDGAAHVWVRRVRG